MRLSFRHHGRHIAVDLHADGGRYRVVVDQRPYAVEARYLDDSTLLLEVNGRRHTIRLARQGGERFIALAGETFHLAPDVADTSHALAVLAQPEIRAPMPGKVLQVLVAPGTKVEGGDGLLILEAMKMENRLTAPADGIVEEVRVEAGQMVDGGQVLVVLSFG